MTSVGPFGGGSDPEPIRVSFLCVENAGRSQMAAALAERERARRGLTDRVEIESAGTHPASAVYDTVVEAMAEIGLDIADRTPRVVQVADLDRMGHVVMMGCYVAEFDPTTFDGETRDWDLPNVDDADMARVRAVRDAIDARVSALFDDIESELNAVEE